MYLGRVIGTVWATRRHQALAGGRMVLVQPLDDDKAPVGEPLAALDTVGSGPGEIVVYVTAYEAAIPWLESHPGLEVAGIDASVIGIVDRVDTGASA
jgi:ethanolamine utilization protein EutN